MIEMIDGQKIAKGLTKHQSVRYQMLIQALEKLFQTEYPDGLTVHNYEELFGTMRTVLFRPEEGTMDHCFDSPV
ncbi:hypothetical protein WAX46_04765 [Bacillus sp. FJAT-53060]|uniref:carcinine hydrolase/isopenicillin-N N-acyltransferase family protein n=1 Tax=Bacillus TaxID=1386 RepID=UPI001CFAFFD3|nr:hypothetical protein [Bacillus stratosphericus]